MRALELQLGEAIALRRILSVSRDPLSLYAALTDRGQRSDTLLLEGAGGRAFIVDKAAVRAECRGREVTLTALSSGGRRVLKVAASQLRRYVAASAEDILTLSFPKTDEEGAEARLIAPSPFDALRSLVQHLKSLSADESFALFTAGIVSFDHVDMFESLPMGQEDVLGFPDYQFWLAESLIVLEPHASLRLICTAFGSDCRREAEQAHHEAAQRLARLVERCEAATESVEVPATVEAPAEVAVDIDDESFASLVDRLKRNIEAGDVYQIVPSRTFEMPCSDPVTAFAKQRRLDPSPYMFFVSGPGHILFGASPESAVRIYRDEGWPIVEVRPIAGTRARGETPDLDDRLEADLRLDEKETAEHMMLVDLARNDVARISIPGTRRVASLLKVERFARVMHLVSLVRGNLAIGFDAFHALQACLNVGTLTGAPKLKAMELLRQCETTRRGPYGGAVGWVSGAGEMDSAVIIRSAVVRDGQARVRAGAGVVHDSDPLREADETRRKASAVLIALASAEAAR